MLKQFAGYFAVWQKEVLQESWGETMLSHLSVVLAWAAMRT